MLQSPDTDLPTPITTRALERIIITGCSGGGKSSLIAELGARGHRVFEEPGRQVVREQTLIGGRGLPWEDLTLFVELTVSRSLFFAMESLAAQGLSFFDRSAIDQVSALAASGAALPPHLTRALTQIRYHPLVFLVPPWPQIYETDAERRHGFADAVSAYEALEADYRALGYEPVILPKIPVKERADLVLTRLQA